jgi:hypothetical protein
MLSAVSSASSGWLVGFNLFFSWQFLFTTHGPSSLLWSLLSPRMKWFGIVSSLPGPYQGDHVSSHFLFLPPDHDQHGQDAAEGASQRAVEWGRAPVQACHPRRPQDWVPSVSPG